MQAALEQYLEGYNTRRLLQGLRLWTAKSEGEDKYTEDQTKPQSRAAA